MEDLMYFIKEFISKNRQERWEILAKGKWSKFGDKLHGLEKHLNEKCILIEKNAHEKFNEIVKQKKISHGTYIECYDGISVMKPLNSDLVRDDSLIICKEDKIAFFFHHEGWIWICQ